MKSTVRKAVIPAAGFGTRVLPASKAVPKEMLPIAGKPAMQYIVEEAVLSGIEEILIIISSGKESIADHFDRDFELEYKLKEAGKNTLYQEMIDIANLANITFIRQKEAKGLGHAIMCAENFVGDEPFAVLYGDDVIISKTPVCKQLVDAYQEYNLPSVGIKSVPENQIHKYSSLQVNQLHDNLYKVDDMVEKPATPEEAFSLFSILGRCVLTPEIFSLLKDTKPGVGGEIQLTDAMKVYAQKNGMVGVDFEGKRYDMGSKLGILQASVEVGLTHPEFGNEFKEYLQDIVSKL